MQVTVDAKFKCMLGNKRKILQIEVVPEVSEPTFKKNGENILYAIPPSVEIINNGANNRVVKTGS